MKNITVKSYETGFIFSLVLTLTAYLVVTAKLLSGQFLIGFVLFLAILQMLVQLIFFLHLLGEKKPRWNLAIFVYTVSIILMVIVGSLWIMKNLNYRMTPDQMYQYIIHDEAIH